MTVSTYLSQVLYFGNGLAKEFAIPFKFQQNADIQVELRVESTGALTALTLHNDYQLTGANAESGGACTLNTAPAVGTVLTIRRDFPFTQETDLPNAGAFHAETHEDAFDRVTMMCQQLQRETTADAWPIWPPGTNGTLPVPKAEWLLAWNAQGTALENVNPFELGAPIEPIGGADAVWINGWNEFAYSTLPVMDDGQKALNAVLDSKVRLRDGDKWEADFVHILRDDLPRTKARKVVLWYQWFTYKDNLGNAAPQVSYTTSQFFDTDPDIYTVDTSARGGPKWNIDGTDGWSAVQVGPNIEIQPGGTVADVSLVHGMRELVARGYEVGICPIVSFYDPTKFVTGDYFYWRGLATWPDLATFTTWLDDYKLLHRHAIDLMALADCSPWIVYVGSEMRWLSAEAPPDIMSAWFLALHDLADEWKAAFPGCKISYSASDHEAGYFNGEHSMDALWSHPSVDYLGFSWYKPLAVKHTNNYGVLRAGVTSGERFDYYTEYDAMEARRWLSGSDGLGKTNETLIAMPARESWQNGAAAWKMAHYARKRDGVVAGTSPLPGHNATMCDGVSSNAVILPDLTGTATRSRAAGTRRDLGPGLLPPPVETDYFLHCDGTTAAVTYFPGTINHAITGMHVRLRFKFVDSTNDYPRVLRVETSAGDTVCDVQLNKATPATTYALFSYRDTLGSSHFYTLQTFDMADAPVVIEVDALLTATSLVLNGTTHALTGTPSMPDPGSKLYLGGYNTGFATADCDIYFASFEGLTATANRKLGGQWFFEDDYGGVRSAFVPESKRPIATEVGFASINGSCVEPNAFPEVKRGTGVLPAPEWFDDHSYWYGRGIEDIKGPVGSKFNADQYHQAICLSAAVSALREAGFVHQVAYNLDARPGAALEVLNGDGTYYFGDGPNLRISHAMNGKLAGGTINEVVDYTVTPAVPQALTGTGASKIFFVRHAKTTTDVNGNYIRDFTAEGDQQVLDLPAKLAAFGVNFDIVICSPTWRTVNTIRAWLESQDMKAEIWPELTESSWLLVGDETNKIEGGLVIPLHLEKAFELRERGHGTLNADTPYPCRVYGETSEAGRNMVAFCNTLIRSRFSGKGVNVLVVGHYHAGARLLDMLQGNSSASYNPNLPPYQLGNGEVSYLTEDGANYRLDWLNDQVMYNGALAGSTWVHIGDSISTDRYWVGWPDGTRNGELETRLKFTLAKNASHGGRTVRDSTHNGHWLFCLQDVLTFDFSTVDVVTLFCGTNDWSGGLQLGAIGDAASKDAYSFYANLKYVIEWLHGQNTSMKIVLMSPLQRVSHTTPNAAGFTLSQFVAAYPALRTHYAGLGYDIEYIDLFNGNVLYWNSAIDETTSTYTYDGLHPEWDTPGETDCITDPVFHYFLTNHP